MGWNCCWALHGCSLDTKSLLPSVCCRSIWKRWVENLLHICCTPALDQGVWDMLDPFLMLMPLVLHPLYQRRGATLIAVRLEFTWPWSWPLPLHHWDPSWLPTGLCAPIYLLLRTYSLHPWLFYVYILLNIYKWSEAKKFKRSIFAYIKSINKYYII